jgi:hypothetical protein
LNVRWRKYLKKAARKAKVGRNGVVGKGESRNREKSQHGRQESIEKRQQGNRENNQHGRQESIEKRQQGNRENRQQKINQSARACSTLLSSFVRPRSP